MTTTTTGAEPDVAAAAREHIDGCGQCRPFHRLPELCGEGKRLTLAVADALQAAAQEANP